MGTNINSQKTSSNFVRSYDKSSPLSLDICNFSDNLSLRQVYPHDSQLTQEVKFPEISPVPRAKKIKTLFSYSIIDQRQKKLPALKKDKQVFSRCRCKRSQCMRLHCQCFQNQGFCSPLCKCLNCLNTSDNSELKKFVISKMKLIDPSAFEEKITKVDGVEGINSKGCSCKIGCNRNYCECFKLQVGCSPICRCEGCKNKYIDIERKKITQIFKSPHRKKHRLLFNLQKEGDTAVTQVVFKMFKSEGDSQPGPPSSPDLEIDTQLSAKNTN